MSRIRRRKVLTELLRGGNICPEPGRTILISATRRREGYSRQKKKYDHRLTDIKDF